MASSEPRFTVRQLVAIAGTLSAISGAGGAFTVAAQDAVQDQRLEEHERAITELRGQVLEGTKAAMQTQTTVKSLGDDVDEIKADTKEIQRLLNRLIGGRGNE